ncbi:MAG: DUF308 domain-containing protein [Bacillota bacterium]|nr:DUF308 domain-containing protein [Bacillota bacterium]
MLKCKNCGADIPFNPETQTYICPYCNSEFTHEELSEQEQAGQMQAEEQVYQEEEEMEVFVYTCPQCGGELITTEETYATFCSYCGSSVILEQKKQKEEKPAYIIPFKITKEQAEHIYNEKMRKAIFAPSYMKRMNVEKVRGIYMPYWTYSIHTHGGVQAEKDESMPTRGGTLIKTYDVRANIDWLGDGIEYDASSSFPDDLSQAAGPFDFKKAKKFAASYMSGFYADRGNMPKEAYSKAAEADLVGIGSNKLAERMQVAKGAIKYNTRTETRAQKAMYPVWFVFARNEQAQKISYAIINGENGKIAADIPFDPKKLILGTFIFAIPIFLFLYLFLVPTPRITDIIIAMLSGISLIFTIFQMVQNKPGEYVLPLISNIVSIIVCVFLAIVNPFQDGIHYIGICAATLFSLFAYISLFHAKNKNMQRDLPQLGKRGGDEYAQK